MQQYYYHGLIPFTQYRKERKESRKETKPVVESLISNVHRPPAYSLELAKAPTRQDQQNRFYDLEKGRKTVR